MIDIKPSAEDMRWKLVWTNETQGPTIDDNTDHETISEDERWKRTLTNETQGPTIDDNTDHETISEDERWKRTWTNGREQEVEHNHFYVSAIKKRKCCQLSGRVGDKYCNICGKVVPDKWIYKKFL